MKNKIVIFFVAIFFCSTAVRAQMDCTINVVPDLPLLASDEMIETEIEQLFTSYVATQISITSPPNSTQLLNAQNQFEALDIVVDTDGNISGNEVDFNQVGFLKTVARQLWHSPGDTLHTRIANQTVWWMYEQLCNNQISMDNNGYRYRFFGRAAVLLRDHLTTENKDRFGYTLFKHNQDFLHFWAPQYDQAYQLEHGAINTDHIYNFSDILLAYGSWANTPEERYRFMRGFKRYYERFSTATLATTDGIKVDGSGFHHWTAYSNYMYAYNTAQNVIALLSGTQFQIDETHYLLFREAVMARFIPANDSRVDALSNCGRKPYERIVSQFQNSLRSFAIAGGEILGLPHEDRVVSGMYNRIWGDFSGFQENIPTPEEEREGYYQFNYANLGVYRKDNWVANSKGFTDNLFGAEIYHSENRYGRYQSYGALEIIYPGNLEQGNGYDLDTWNWNFNPGTTSILLPWDKLHAERGRIDEIQEHRFAGALSFNNKNSNILNKTHGTFGLFAMNFQEREGLGWSTIHSSENHNNTFTFRKSVFAIEDMLICLGSNINNDDTQHPTVTTLFQRIDNKEIAPIVNNATSDITNSWDGLNDNWLISNYGTGFYILEGSGQLHLSSGDQQTPNHNQVDPNDYQDNPVKDYYTSYLNHGTSPTNQSYEYIVKPNATASDMTSLAADISAGEKPYEIHQQNEEAHIIESIPNHIWGYSIFEDTVNFDNTGLINSCGQKCLIMYQLNPTSTVLDLAVADPELDFESRGVALPIEKDKVITLKGNWELESEHPKFEVLDYVDSTTIVSVKVVDGMPQEATFVALEPVASSENVLLEGNKAAPQIFPNPILKGTSFTISGLKANAPIKIFNSQGLLFDEYNNYNATSLEINTKHFITGLYFITINDIRKTILIVE